MAEDHRIKVRDLRSKEKFFIDDYYYDGGYIGRLILSTFAVYAALCRHADRGQKCYPSFRHISRKLKISRRNVIRAIRLLEEFNIIGVKKKAGKTNTYYLIDRNKWKRFKGSDTTDTSISGVTTPVSLLSPPVVTPRIPEGNTIEGNTKKDTDLCIKAFMEYFNQKTAKHLSLTPIRERIIKARLKDYTLDELKRAVDKFIQDDWPERKNYMDIIYCIGIAPRKGVDYLEKWLNWQPKSLREAVQKEKVQETKGRAEKKLGKLATKKEIKQTLKQTPQQNWWIIRDYLKSRYKDGEKAYYEAEQSLVKDMRRA